MWCDVWCDVWCGVWCGVCGDDGFICLVRRFFRRVVVDGVVDRVC